MELLRATPGESILTLQFKVEGGMGLEDALLGIDGEGLDVMEALREYDVPPDKAFLDRPARGAVVIDLNADERPEVAGPAEWAFVPIAAPAQAAPAGGEAVAAERDGRFDGKQWWEEPAGERDARFAPLEVR